MSRPIVGINADGTIACNCLIGTAQVVNGQCTCINPPLGTPVPIIAAVPPMPTQILPAGYQWTYNATLHKWIPTRILSITSSPNDILHPVTNWIQNNKGLSLAIAAGAFYFFTKK